MSEVRHKPVMLRQVLAAMAPANGDIIVDGTFGAGGYSKAFLNEADCTVIAIDRDPDAIAGGQALTARYGERLRLMPGCFSEMAGLLQKISVDRVNGVTLDVGVSSMQLDQAERGFSFQNDGPLDMRMSRAGQSAADVVNGFDETALADIIFQYGEERKSRRVAKAIVTARQSAPIERTLQLAGIVAPAVGGRPGKGPHPATRTFQALRIYVNAELDELRRGLIAAEKLLAPEGRLAVVSFHSLEDRQVKRFLARRTGSAERGSRHFPCGPEVARAPSFRLMKRGAQKPTDQEISENARARSARLRIAYRTDAPAWPEEIAA